MDRDTVKKDFEAMMRTFTCAKLDVRFKGKEVEGLLSSLSSDARLTRTGMDQDWEATIFVDKDELDPQVIESQDLIEVRERGESQYTEYRCRKPKIVAQAYYRIDLAAKYSGT